MKSPGVMVFTARSSSKVAVELAVHAWLRLSAPRRAASQAVRKAARAEILVFEPDSMGEHLIVHTRRYLEKFIIKVIVKYKPEILHDGI